MIDPKVWEIWYADFRFEDCDDSKDRTVLVLEIEGVYYVSAMITSHEKRSGWGDVDVSRWKSAGLDHPSTIRLSRIWQLPRTAFRRRVGELKPEDIELIRRML